MGYKFLVIDDERPALSRLMDTLKELYPSCEVKGAMKVGEALAILEDNYVPHVVFMDIEMPQMTGIELAQRVKKIALDTKVVFVTGFAQYAVEAFKIHVDGYIVKPATKERIQDEITNLKIMLEEHLVVKCFGKFEVYYNGMPVDFKHTKSRELLAFLIANKGAMCSNGEIISALWDDGSPDHASYLRTLKSDVVNTLEAIGKGKVIVKKRDSLGLNIKEISCDYIRAFLNKEPIPETFMEQYSWSDMYENI